MATQLGDGVEFSIAQNFTNFRLVELPEELVKLLASDNPPPLELKSEASSSNAVLCTQSKSFPIRSVHTSNSLFIIHPVLERNDEDALPASELRAVASCSATIELLTTSESALLYLRKALPIYSTREVNTSAAVQSSFRSIANDVPLSTQEIQDSWSELCAFEDGGASFRPIAGILLELWKAIYTGALLENIDLGSAFLHDDLWVAVADEDFPRGLFDAALRRIEDRNAMEVEAEEGAKWTTVDKTVCSAWVAALILETQGAGDHTLKATDFLNVWRNNLFESWRDIPSLHLDLIKNISVQPTSGTIALKPEHRLAGVPAILPQAGETKGSSKARKWHEKFKKTRA